MNPEDTVYIENEFTYSPKRMERALRTVAPFLKSQQILRLIAAIIILAYIILFYFVLQAYDSYRYFIFVVATFTVFSSFVSWFASRNGGIQYKRMLSMNNGEPPCIRIGFTDTAIDMLGLNNGNRNQLPYSLVRSICETDDMVVILLQHRQFIPLDKQTLTGGTPEELAAFLAQRCPQMKPRKLRCRLPGLIVRYTPDVITLLGVLLALLPC